MEEERIRCGCYFRLLFIVGFSVQQEQDILRAGCLKGGEGEEEKEKENQNKQNKTSYYRIKLMIEWID